MSKPMNAEAVKYYCPFCSKEILPKEVLFADEDKNASLISESEYDPQRFNDFESRVLSFSDVNTPDGGIVSMEPRPVYRYHRWTKPDGDLPYQEPISVSVSDKSPFPEDITILRSNGMTPKQLSGKEAAPWAVVEKAEETPKEPEKKESTAAMLRKAVMGAQTAKQEETENNSKIYKNIELTLTEKVCPHCHCVLPENFGELETYRVAMLGGTRSGKTTYMVAAANLLKQQNGLPSGVINSCTISKESARYFDFLIKCMEYNKLAATVLADQTVIRFVFPIVMNVTTVDDTGSEREFILIVNDIPGEAMENKTFLMNYPGLCLADAAIMLMDPMQFVTAVTMKNQLARSDLEMLHNTGEAIDENDVKAHRVAQFTPYSFGDTLDSVKRMITDNKFTNLSCFTLVLNKLDLLYAGENPYIDENVAPYLSYIHGIHHLSRIGDSADPAQSQHDDGVDLELIRRINNQVVYLIQNRLRFTGYESAIRPMADITGEIMTLCTSVRTWNKSKNNFCRPTDENGKAEAETIIGFRLLEPLLYVLARMGLVRTKEHVDVVVEETEKPWWKKIFSRD